MNRQSVLKSTALLLLILGAPMSASALDVGEKAPIFKGASTMGDVRLDEYLGKQHVVLALYFAVFTPV